MRRSRPSRPRPWRRTKAWLVSRRDGRDTAARAEPTNAADTIVYARAPSRVTRVCTIRRRCARRATPVGESPRGASIAAMGQRSDEDLFLAFTRQRDCTALGALFRRRADELLRIAVFLAPRPTDAEDLVQATFLSAIAHAETWRGGRVMNWLCGILTNHARMLRRAERRPPPQPDTDASENEPLL